MSDNSNPNREAVYIVAVDYSDSQIAAMMVLGLSGEGRLEQSKLTVEQIIDCLRGLSDNIAGELCKTAAIDSVSGTVRIVNIRLYPRNKPKSLTTKRNDTDIDNLSELPSISWMIQNPEYLHRLKTALFF